MQHDSISHTDRGGEKGSERTHGAQDGGSGNGRQGISWGCPNKRPPLCIPDWGVTMGKGGPSSWPTAGVSLLSPHMVVRGVFRSPFLFLQDAHLILRPTTLVISSNPTFPPIPSHQELTEVLAHPETPKGPNSTHSKGYPPRLYWVLTNSSICSPGEWSWRMELSSHSQHKACPLPSRQGVSCREVTFDLPESSSLLEGR